MEPRLRIELVPRGLWGNSLANELPRERWRAVRAWALDRARNACEICGAPSPGGKGLICHEVWDYDDERGVQTLADVEIHCAECDRVTHFGRTTTLGRPDLVEAAMIRLGAVNEWSVGQIRDYVDAVREQWQARSGREWTQDRSWYDRWLSGQGVEEQLRGEAQDHRDQH